MLSVWKQNQIHTFHNITYTCKRSSSELMQYSSRVMACNQRVNITMKVSKLIPNYETLQIVGTAGKLNNSNISNYSHYKNAATKHLSYI